MAHQTTITPTATEIIETKIHSRTRRIGLALDCVLSARRMEIDMHPDYARLLARRLVELADIAEGKREA